MQRLGGRQVIMTSCNESLFAGMDVNMIHVDEGCYEMACPVKNPFAEESE